MIRPERVSAISSSEDFLHFVREPDPEKGLSWKIPENVSFQDISFPSDLVSEFKFSENETRLDVAQLAPMTANQPVGIYLVKFATSRPYVTHLRKIVRGIDNWRGKPAHLPTFSTPNVMFICTPDWKDYTFAHFAGEKWNTAKLATFGWEQGSTYLRTVCEHNLTALRFPEDQSQWQEQWLKAWDVEKVTKSFYIEFKQVFRETRDTIKGLDKHELHDFTMMLFNRLLFMKFLERKGWLDFNRNYFQDMLVKNGKQNFYQETLLKIFFHGLNRQNHTAKNGKETRHYCEKIGVLPFLNGDLFSKHEIDERTQIPNEAFEVIFSFFSRYNFTVMENTPLDLEVAVDPEMLGKIFENLINSPEDEKKGKNKRKETGSYYTPRPVVEFMCREALTNYLQTAVPRLTINEARVFVDEGKPPKHSPEEILTALKRAKVLDPACGSGAFLVQMLHELVRLRAAIFPYVEDDARTNYERKLEIIQNNLYGTDIQEFATNIAKLRFWLSLVVDFHKEFATKEDFIRAVDTQGIPPLPNLSYKIRAGDALIEKIGGVVLNAQGSFAIEDVAIKELRRLKSIYQSPDRIVKSGKPKDWYDKEITRIEEKLEREALEWCGASAKVLQTNSILWRIHFAEVFEPEYNATIHDELSLVNEAQGQQTMLESNQVVFGFDIVIGNPPYGIINKLQNKHIGHAADKATVTALKSSELYRPALGGMINVYRLFVVRGFDLLKHNGICVMIVPYSLLTDQSASGLRKYVLEQQELLYVEAFPERDNENIRLFEASKMSTCIFMALKRRKDARFRVRTHYAREIRVDVPTVYLDKAIIKKIDPRYLSIPICSERELEILSKISVVNQNTMSLSAIGNCFAGEVDITFCKHLFTTDRTKGKLIKGAQVNRYELKSEMSQGEIEWLDTKRFHEENNGKRSEHNKHERIVMQAITGVNEKIRLKMTLIPKGNYCANSLNYIIIHDSEYASKYLLGILNSTLLNWRFKKTSTNSNVNNYEIEALPIAQADEHQQRSIIAFVEKILTAKHINSETDTSKWEDEIDKLAYKLYGLTEKESALVENDFRKTMLAPSLSQRQPMHKAGRKRQQLKAA